MYAAKSTAAVLFAAAAAGLFCFFGSLRGVFCVCTRVFFLCNSLQSIYCVCTHGLFLFILCKCFGEGGAPLLQRRCSPPSPTPSLLSSTGTCRCVLYAACVSLRIPRKAVCVLHANLVSLQVPCGVSCRPLPACARGCFFFASRCRVFTAFARTACFFLFSVSVLGREETLFFRGVAPPFSPLQHWNLPQYGKP